MVHKTVVHFEIPANDPQKISKFCSESFGWKIEKSDMEAMDYWLLKTSPDMQTVGGGVYKRMTPSNTPRN